jgi:hypothetical protein
MYKVILMSFLLSLLLNSCKPQQKTTILQIGDTFPTIEAQTLEDKKIIFPDDTKGKITVLATGFAQNVQDPINTWTELILKKYPTISYFEVPIGNSMGALFSKQIDNAMKEVVPKELHPMTATYYGVLCNTYKQQFGATGNETCYIFLLDKEGNIAFKAVGSVSESIKIEFDSVYLGLNN